MARGGNFDYRQIERLKRQIEQLQRDRDAFCRDCAKELAARLLRKVKQRTPVGQYPGGSGQTGGTLRRGWTIGEITKNGDTYGIEINNPTEYASYVEYGHRTASHGGWVPGQFMMTISEREIQELAPALLERKLQNYLRRCLDA